MVRWTRRKLPGNKSGNGIALIASIGWFAKWPISEENMRNTLDHWIINSKHHLMSLLLHITYFWYMRPFMTCDNKLNTNTLNSKCAITTAVCSWHQRCYQYPFPSNHTLYPTSSKDAYWWPVRVRPEGTYSMLECNIEEMVAGFWKDWAMWIYERGIMLGPFEVVTIKDKPVHAVYLRGPFIMCQIISLSCTANRTMKFQLATASQTY